MKTKINYYYLLAFLLGINIAVSAQQPSVSGELMRWHKVSLTFSGPNTSEKANPNPFSYYNLEVTFKHQGGATYVVPGYFAACGNAEDNGCDSGNKWRVNFTPDRTGQWTWTASFKKGTDVAINGGGSSAGFMNGASGNFNVSESNKSGKDLRSKSLGRVKYVGEHYLKHVGTNPSAPNGPWFLKAGADSPENALNYVDFDATPSINNNLNKIGTKTWAPHQRDYVSSDAGSYTWGSGKGTEILGMVNYLSSQGANVMSFLTWNTDGDGGAVFPHILKVSLQEYASTSRGQQWNKVHQDRFDVSKLDQWENVMSYADKKGMYLHFKTMETENDNKMDGNGFGRERKLYYRELIARFGHHLALNWNITEETTLTDNVVRSTASYIKSVDPYDHHIVIHTYPNEQDKRYPQLLGNASELTGASIQTSQNNIHNDVKRWLERSRNSGKKWVVANDEQGTPGEGIRVSDLQVRNKVLWATLLAGGAGVEYYSGYTTDDGDINGNDHRKRGGKYRDGRRALDFFNNYLQDDLINMVSSDNVTSDGSDYVFAQSGKIYAIYRPSGGSTSLSLPSGNANYTVQWYNPRTGGGLTSAATLGNSLVAPDSADWVALIKSKGNTVIPSAPPVSGSCDYDFEEVNGRVVMEAENMNVSGTSWTKKTSKSGYTGASYIEWLGSDSFNTPGKGTVTVKVKINSAGKYRFQWRNRVGLGTNSTEHNDTWLRFADASAFYGQDGSSKVYPRGNTQGKSSYPEGSSSNGWFKIYLSGTTNWTFNTYTSDNDPHEIYVEFNTPGVYTMEISGRSKNHLIDRVVLAKSGVNITSLSNAETKCTGETVPTTPTAPPTTGACDYDFEEVNGRALIEAENINVSGTSWSKKTSKSGYTGASYLEWLGSDSFNTPGNGTITAKVKINSAGKYRFQWRSRVGLGTNSTEHNDTWLRFADASAFYGQDGTSKVYPRGNTQGKSSYPEGSSSNGWFKIYLSSTTDWTFNTYTSDNDPHEIYVEFDKPGIYTMEISGRSKNHLIDRIVLAKSGVNLTSLSNQETLCTGETTPTTPPTSECEIKLSALSNFSIISGGGFSPAYKDVDRNALAIDAALYKNKYAAAQTSFNGNTGNYNLTLTTLKETDGESTYRVFVNNQLVGSYKNPETSVEFQAQNKTFSNVYVRNGDNVRVEFNSHTNGKIPEGSSTAYARGRWTSLTFTCAGSNDNASPSVSVSANNVKVGETTVLSASASDSDGSIAKVDFYINNKLVKSDTGSPYSYSYTPQSTGTYSVKAVATDNDNASTTSTTSFSVTSVTTSTGGVFNVPGVVAVDGYTSKSGSVRVESRGNLGWIKNGDAIEYDINVTKTGMYDLVSSLSSDGAGGRILIYIDGALLGNKYVPVNGAWYSYYYKTEDLKATLTAGKKKLRIVFTGEDDGYLYNVSSLEFKVRGTSKFTNSKGGDIEDEEEIAQIKVFPNPAVDYVTITNGNALIGKKIEVYDVKGSLLLRTTNNAQTTINVSSFESGIYLINVEGKEDSKVFKIIKQ